MEAHEQRSPAEHYDELIDPPRILPVRLWQQFKADPTRAPEHLAIAAGEAHGPAAAEWIAEMRGRYAHQPPELALMAKRPHATLSRWGGAAGGVGGAWTMIPDIAALAWVQSRMVFYIAAAYGYDPLDPMRPAEYLAIRGFYPDPLAARAALDGVGTTVAEQYLGDRMSGSEEKLLMRLTRLTVRKGGLAARGSRLAARGSRLAGKMIPGFAIAFNAVTNERETRAVAKDAMKFYGG